MGRGSGMSDVTGGMSMTARASSATFPLRLGPVAGRAPPVRATYLPIETCTDSYRLISTRARTEQTAAG